MPTVLALARTEARRFARHPLFLFGIAVMVFAMGDSLAPARTGAGPTR